jgi:hypothetical protein
MILGFRAGGISAAGNPSGQIGQNQIIARLDLAIQFSDQRYMLVCPGQTGAKLGRYGAPLGCVAANTKGSPCV